MTSTIQGRFRLRREAFELDAQFEFPAHGVTALYGRSGSGKTTLLRCMAGLEHPEEGWFQVLNLDELGNSRVWQNGARKIFVPPHLRDIGYVFQEPRLFPHLSVKGNLQYGFKRTPAKQRQIEFDRAVQALSLEPFLERRTRDLSGGEQQRVAIGRALLISPVLILMDEPLTGLDETSKSEIVPYIEDLHRTFKIPIVYVSHSMEEIARIADHILFMEAGKIKASVPFLEATTSLDLLPPQAQDAAAVLEARIASHDEDFGLTYLEFSGGTLSVPRRALQSDRPIRVRIAARDVSLTLSPPQHTSILNVLPARITEIAERGPTNLMIKLDAGGVPILAQITRKSGRQLELNVGTEVYAQIKGVALI